MSIGSVEVEGGWRARARWGLAAAIVLVAHVAGAWVIARHEPEASTGEEASAILIELAPLPVAPAVEPVAAAPEPEVTPPQPEPELGLPAPPEPAEPTFDAADLQPPPAPPVPEPEVVMPEPPKKRPEAEQPESEVKKPEVKSAQRPLRQDERNEKKPPKPQTKVAAAPPRPQDGAAVPAAPALGSASSMSAAPANWRGALMARLNRAKRPFGTRPLREGNIVRVTLTIDRSGNVLNCRIVGNSVSPSLDQEALAVVQRASPLPPPPAEVAGARISLTVPIRFESY